MSKEMKMYKEWCEEVIEDMRPQTIAQYHIKNG